MPTQTQLIAQLQDRASAKRRSAARHLRKLADPAAGKALLAALERELEDPRTWETQYQMIMALGTCGYRDATSLLQDLARRSLEATMVYVAIGDALVRLSRARDDDAKVAIELLASGNDSLIDGALRAVAMLRMKLPAKDIDAILRFVQARPLDDRLRFWPAAAAADWSGPRRDAFLAECARSNRKDLRDTAARSLQGTYKVWAPL